MAIGDVKVKEEETVAGRLKKFTESGSPAMQYASALGRREAGARGLTNSSIAVGAAAEQVMRYGSDVAKADANIFSQSNIADAANKTALEQQRLSDVGAMDRTKLTTDTQLKIQTQGDKAAKERLASQIASQEKIATAQNKTQKEIQTAADTAALARVKAQITSNEAMALADQANKMAIVNAQSASALAVAQERTKSAAAIESARSTSAENINTATLTSNAAVQAARNASNEKIASANAAAIAAENELDRLSQQNIAKWNNEAALQLQTMKENFGITSEYRNDATNAWQGFSNGIAQIDTTASPASQTEQFNRINESFQARMKFLNTSRISDLANKGMDATDNDAMEAYTKAQQVGMTAAELDTLGGVPAGTAQSWIQSKGLAPLPTSPKESAAAKVASASTTPAVVDTSKVAANFDNTAASTDPAYGVDIENDREKP